MTDVLITGNLVVNGTNDIVIVGETDFEQNANISTAVNQLIAPVTFGISGINTANVSISTGVVTINDPGMYIVSGQVIFSGSNTTGNWRQIWANINGVQYNNVLTLRPPSSGHTCNSFGFSRSFSASDTFSIESQAHFTSGTMVILGNVSGNIFSKMHIDYINF